jgi:hypothetical protein
MGAAARARMSFAPPAQSPAAQMFARQRYVAVAGLVSPEEASAVRQHMEKLQADGFMNLADSQVPNTPAIYGDPVLERLMVGLLPKMEFLTGLTLYPTYSYARLYKHGDVLKPHTDRAACEISVTLNLGQIPEEPWPIYLRMGQQPPVAAALRPGDALLYRGMEIVHWRDAYPGQHLAQAFLHYVDGNGPHASEMRDRRQALGMPPVPR